MTKKELWNPLTKVVNDSGIEFDFTDLVSVSNRGKVFVHPYQRNENFLSGYIVEGRPAGGEHMQISLTDKNNKKAFFYVHRLVAFAWLEKKPHQNDVMHLDDNPMNNCVENLRWCTHSENMQDIHNKGRRMPGPERKYSTDLIWEVFRRRERGESIDSIRAAYPNVTRSTIQHMTSGKMLRDRKVL
jgi:hypothetical protein